MMVKKDEALGGGDLRWKVRLEKRTASTDGYGNTQGAFTPQFTRRAYIGPMKGGESVIAGRLEGRAPTIIVVRHDPETVTITTDWIAVEVLGDGTDGKTFNIRQIDDMERRNRFLTLLCEYGVAS